MKRAVDAVAGLTAVDGATLITSRYEVLAFGTKITRREGAPRPRTTEVSVASFRTRFRGPGSPNLSQEELVKPHGRLVPLG